MGVDQKTESIIFQIFRKLAASNKIVLVVNHDLGESVTNFDDLILLNKDIIAVGERTEVLQEENIHRAYRSKISFFGND